MTNNSELRFEITKIVIDKILLIFALLIVATASFTFFEIKKQDIIFENKISLKFIDRQLETYQVADQVMYYNYLRLYQLLQTKQNKNNFSNIMNEVQKTTQKLNELLEKLHNLLIKNSSFLTLYSLEKIYMPFLLDMNQIEESFILTKNDYGKSMNIAENNIKISHKYKALLLNYNEIFKKVNKSNETKKIKLISSIY